MCFWIVGIHHKIVLEHRATQDPLVSHIVGWQSRPSFTMPPRACKRRDAIGTKRKKKRRKTPVGRFTHRKHVADFPVIISGTNHALAQSALCFFPFARRYCSCYARHVHVIASPWSSVFFVPVFFVPSAARRCSRFKRNISVHHQSVVLFPSFRSPLGSPVCGTRTMGWLICDVCYWLSKWTLKGIELCIDKR